MRRFLHGLLWGGIVGTVIGAIALPASKLQKKPIKKLLAEQSAEAVIHKTEDVIQSARRARRRLIRKLDE